ncbi:adaptive-response sensory-kinase SasA [Deinococcus carri]|uniref:histidine kinase n=1 Tax=Deinococcus carri TaxID=1211323 RepID=A0ABP9W5W8_9DEIO
MFRRLTLGVRLALVWALVVGACLLVMGTWVAQAVERTQTLNADRQLRGVAGRITNLLGAGRTPPEVQALLELGTPQLEVWITTPAGRAHWGVQPLPLPLPDDRTGFQTLAAPCAACVWRLYTVKTPAGARVRVALWQGQDRRLLHRLRRNLWTFGPLVLLLCSLSGLWLTRAALAPARRLARATVTIARQGHWSARLAVPTARDETAQTARAINTLLTHLEEALQTERRFVAYAAHELNTPLTVIRGRLERAVKRQNLGQIGLALTAVDELTALTHTLLDHLRAETLAAERQPLQVLPLTAQLLEELRELRPHLQLTLTAPRELQSLRSNEDVLRLVLRGLLENAGKYAETTVQVSLAQQRGWTAWTIRNDGRPFPVELLARVGEPYLRGAEGDRPGYGLGLSLTRTLVTQLQGTLEFSYEAGYTVATLNLPALAT